MMYHYVCFIAPVDLLKAYPPRRGKRWVGGRCGELDEGAGGWTHLHWLDAARGWWRFLPLMGYGSWICYAICLWCSHHVRFHMFHWLRGVLQWFEEPLISWRWWVEKWGFNDRPASFSVKRIETENIMKLKKWTNTFAASFTGSQRWWDCQDSQHGSALDGESGRMYMMSHDSLQITHMDGKFNVR